MQNPNTRMALLAATSVALGGCQGIVWANMVAVLVTVSLFFGTLSLGRTPSRSNTRPAGSNTSATRTAS